MSLAKIAQTCGINANVLGNWMRLYERGKPAGAAPRGEPIEMPASPAFMAVQMDPAGAARPANAGLDVVVRLPNGVTVEVHGYNSDGTVTLIEALGRVRCSVSTNG
jgi:transposase